MSATFYVRRRGMPSASRGGRGTKIHAIVDSKGRPLSFIVTGGHVHDSQIAEELYDKPSRTFFAAALVGPLNRNKL